jgi:hypothetical protein
MALPIKAHLMQLFALNQNVRIAWSYFETSLHRFREYIKEPGDRW